ncbi:putative transcriptional regulator, TetR family protein [Actinoplanes sp. NBRC 14428]|uniref:TetR family transcriptional regulator n=1 Tax=Pseudosporangium ferrugineum TaxID=439699 RepID=A0A2T0SJD1_9ACTN|nr:TetR/AcrR family transcriptional regulator [Pseudosporangium ferrugineum]PRY33526.1 TetR family transcriptional regulator [Pseudosporangium ferrugineum]BCJ56527.1 putative transcriptional regulator, TetR family protein [Actinoplanes sp. NBRC 14428]
MNHRGNRHGRSEEARRSVLRAADDLLAEKGFAALTIEGIAARAGVAKQTIYRWWPSKTDVLLDAYAEDAAEDLTPPDTGNLADDLRGYLISLARYLTGSDAGAVFRALAGQAQHDPALAARLRQDHLTRQRARDRGPLERAVARGELPAGTDLEVLVDRLVGPVYYRILVTGQEVTEDFVDELVTACTSAPSARS